MNILVTGGAGFIGAALAERLVAAGHRVTAIDDCSTGRAERLGSGVALHLADIAAGDLDAAFRSAAPDAVVHLAAMASIAQSMHAPERCAAVNVCGTVRVLRQCAKHGVPRFVFGSTGGALYGDSAPFPTPESQPAAAVSPYGASKAAAELFVAAMCAPAGIRHTVLRLGNVYGPGVDGTGGSGVVAAFARAALDGKPPAICGDGMQTRDYVHLDDILDAHLRVIDSGRDGVFNLGTGTQRTVLEVFETVAGAAGYRGAPTHGPARPGEARRSCLDSARAARLLGWTACVPFTEGVGGTVRALAEARAR